MEILIIPKMISMLGLAFYLSIAVINNILDKKTNRHFLKQMFSMRLLKEDQELGQGLLKRAICEKKANITLNMIIYLQVIIALLLWFGASQLAWTFLNHPSYLNVAKNVCNIAITMFMVLWFFFWCGGLWLGYWIKSPQIQEVHMKLIMLSISELIFINL